MTTVKYQTARVHWRMGQALLPEHFRAQESGIREDLALRLRLLSTPFWGVASLRWNPFELLKGVVSLQQLTLLLPDGTLVDIPGNTVPASFNLNTSGASRTPLYLHLQGSERDEVVSEDPEGQPDDLSGVERLVQHVILSSTPYSEMTLQSFKLAEFDKAADGTWAPAPDFIPPLVRVSGSPFFEPTLQRIRSMLSTLHQVLQDDMRENYLASESLLAGRECLKGLYRFRSFLANLEKEYHPHPFEVFSALHELYIEVCMLRGIEPAGVDIYKHEELDACFRQLLEQLESQVQLARSATPYIPFTRKEGLMACMLPEAARKARRVYWLLQKPTVAYRLDLAGMKLASESRLPVVHQLALRGIPFRRMENPPFHHPFSSEVEFYVLSEGEEWDHAVREGKLAFFHRQEFEQVRGFLYWRDE
ncbi:type VI secretion system baseplate subunit TssK [Myxococcaceae bacterium GXIMD 01537]